MSRTAPIVFAVCLTLLCGKVPAAEPSVELAGFINQSTDMDAGMALVVNDSDGKLTAALAKGHRLTVQGCTWDARTVQSSRAVLLAMGVTDRASIALIEADALPYADNLVNLLVLPAWGARPLDLAEVLRVLAPEGIGIVGNDANPAATAGLEAKLKQAGAKEIKALDRKGWLRFSKPVDPGFDTWTHNLGGPDLSSVNNDKAAGPWAEVRWIGDPRWGALGGTYSGRVIGGGRIYYAEARVSNTWWVARDAWNGFELWRFPLSGSSTVPPEGPGGTLTCDDRQAYAVDQQVLIARDGTTGKKVKDYAPGFVPAGVSSVGACLLVSDIQLHKVAFGHAAALDKESGKILWTRPAVAHPPAEGGAAFVLGKEELEAVEVATGASRWKVKVELTNGVPRVFCKAGVVYVAYTPSWKPTALLAAYDAGNGGLLWKSDKPAWGGGLPYPDGLWRLDPISKGTNVFVLDPRSGVRKRELQAKGFGKCYPITGCANYLLYCNSTYLDIKAGVEVTKGTVRSPCFLGHVPANGMTYFLPHHCSCGITLRGMLAMAPAGSRKWETNGLPAIVTSGVAPAAPPVEKPDDWPIFRKDTVRSNFTPGKVPEQFKVLWSEKLGNSRLSQAVSAYGLVFTTEPQSHRVFARDAVTGKERWSCIADGRTEYPPALHKGLCLFSTGAGSVYALDALTGKEIWRMRAAPTEKYIAEEGQFASAWPVIGGVMPMNGEIFFTCGRSVAADGGIKMFSVDAATGKIHWRVNGGGGGDLFLSDGKELYLTRVYYRIADGGRVGGGKAPSGILRTTPYLTYLTIADYMACVEPALSSQKHEELTDGQITGENLAFHGDFGVAAWRNRFGTPKTMIKKDWKYNRRFIYAKVAGEVKWLLDENIQQMMGVILVGDTACMAGVPDPPDASKKSELWVLAGANGGKLQVLPLDIRPAYDGLSAAGGRLYLAGEDGTLLCLGGK